MNKDQLYGKLNEINEVLTRKFHKEGDIGILEGSAGISLFFFYYSRFNSSNESESFGAKIIENAINKINEGYYNPSYCSGIVGLAWAIELLVEENFINADTGHIFNDLDDTFYSILISEIKKGNYDFLYGALGYGNYFIKKYKNTKSKKLKDRYRNYILELISQLQKISYKDRNGLKWYSYTDKVHEIEGCNLSLSHGMPGIIIFLAKLHKFSDFSKIVEPLLKDSIKYILSCENINVSISLFPNRFPLRNQNAANSRLAWCYGDLGVGMSMWYASKVLNDKALMENAVRILKHSAKRQTTAKTMVKDASICHGAYGIAQIFNRAYKEAKEIEFKEAANYWIIEGINMAIHKGEYAGYKQWVDKENWIGKVGLLEGIAGIGLVLIEAMSDIDLKWDECLLLS